MFSPSPWFIIFRSFLNRSDCSENFGGNFPMYCIAPRNDFSSFVFSVGFSFNMASSFSSFGLIPFSSISCPSHFVQFIKNSDFLLLALYPTFSSVYKIMSNKSFRGLVCLRGLPRLCSLAKPMYSIQVFSRFFLGISESP